MSVIQLNDPTIGGVIDGNLHSLTCSSISATPNNGVEILTMQDQVAFNKGLYIAPTVEGPTGHNVAIFNGNPTTAMGSILHVYDFQTDKDGKIYDSTINPPVPGPPEAIGTVYGNSGSISNAVTCAVVPGRLYNFNAQVVPTGNPNWLFGSAALTFTLEYAVGNTGVQVPGSELSVLAIAGNVISNVSCLVQIPAGVTEVAPVFVSRGSGTSLGSGGALYLTLTPMLA